MSEMANEMSYLSATLGIAYYPLAHAKVCNVSQANTDFVTALVDDFSGKEIDDFRRDYARALRINGQDSDSLP